MDFDEFDICDQCKLVKTNCSLAYYGSLYAYILRFLDWRRKIVCVISKD